MKIIVRLCSILLCVGILSCGSQKAVVLESQSDEEKKVVDTSSRGNQDSQGMNIPKKLSPEDLANQMNLDAETKAQFLNLHNQQNAKMKNIRKEYGDNPSLFKEKLLEMKQDWKIKLAEILSPEELEQLKMLQNKNSVNPKK